MRKCKYCNGTGDDPKYDYTVDENYNQDDPLPDCPKCKGKGKIK